MRKLKSLWQILWAKYYAVLLGDSEEEISWAIQSLRQADELAKTNHKDTSLNTDDWIKHEQELLIPSKAPKTKGKL